MFMYHGMSKLFRFVLDIIDTLCMSLIIIVIIIIAVYTFTVHTKISNRDGSWEKRKLSRNTTINNKWSSSYQHSRSHAGSCTVKND